MGRARARARARVRAKACDGERVLLLERNLRSQQGERKGSEGSRVERHHGIDVHREPEILRAVGCHRKRCPRQTARRPAPRQ